jgi:hypothetical protein
MTDTYMAAAFVPNDYQAMLLGLVGDDDPAAIQAATADGWRRILAEAGGDVGLRPEPDEWSVLELLGHAVDSEFVSAWRYRLTLAEETPDIAPYDQDLWVGRFHAAGGPEADPTVLLATFEALRASALSLWSRTPDADRRRTGLHRERGPESVGLLFVLIAGHDRFHLAQARRTIDAILSAGGGVGG